MAEDGPLFIRAVGQDGYPYNVIASLLADAIIVVGGMLVILVVILAVLRTNRRDAKDVWEASEATAALLPPGVSSPTGHQDWEVLEGAVNKIAASAVEVRQEVLEVKAELERHLERIEGLDCLTCGQPVRWVSGLGSDVGRWVHAEPGPHSDSVVRPVSHRADAAP